MITIEKKHIWDIFFYLGIIFFAFRAMISNSTYVDLPNFNDNYIDYLLYLSIICFTIKVAGERVYESRVLFLIAFAVFLCVGMFYASSRIILPVVLSVAASVNIPFKQVCKFIFIFESICLAFINFSALFGVIENVSCVLANGNTGYYMGFDYISHEWGYLINILMCYLYIKKEKHTSWLFFISVAILNVILYSVTDITLPYIIVWLILALTIMTKKFGIELTGLCGARVFSTLWIPFCFVICWVSSFLYDSNSPIWKVINELLSNRLEYNQRALLQYGFPLLGNHVEFSFDFVNYNESYYYIDSGYIYSLICYGAIITIISLILYIIIFRYSVNTNNNMLIIWIFAIGLYNIVNENMLNIPINASIFVVGEIYEKYIGENAIESQ